MLFRIQSYCLASLAAFVLSSCSIDDSPVESTATPTEVVFQLHVQPTTALRTVETWSNWTQPVDVAFVAEGGGGNPADAGTGGHGHGVMNIGGEEVASGVLTRSVSSTGEGETMIGSIELPEMRIEVELADGSSMFEIAHDGDVHEHTPKHGQQTMSVKVYETATGHAAHGNATVSHCNVELMAISATDTIEIHFSPVQTEHGLRYQANAELPVDTYDMHLEIEPPEFLRDDETMDRWKDHMEVEIHDFDFDTTFTTGTIGSEMWVGLGGDSLLVTMSGGPVQTYGAIGMGAIPLSGKENINLSVHLEDPTLESHEEQLFGSVVTMSVMNMSTGQTIVETMTPMYGHEGFSFARNMTVNLDQSGSGTGTEGGGDGHGGH